MVTICLHGNPAPALLAAVSVLVMSCEISGATVTKTSCAGSDEICDADSLVYASRGNALVQVRALISGGGNKRTAKNTYEKSVDVGAWGGWCVCPDGQRYNVGDNGNACVSLACIGGTSGECNRTVDPARDGMRAVCAGQLMTPRPFVPPPPPQLVEGRNVYEKVDNTGAWGGWCTCPDGESYNVGDNNDGCGSLACVGGTAGECAHVVDPLRAGMRVTCFSGGVVGATGPAGTPPGPVLENPLSASGVPASTNSQHHQYQRVAGVGQWGGWCTCPDGQRFNVGDNGDACGSLACIGGVPGQCHRAVDAQRAGMRVTCSPNPDPVWNSPVARHGHLRVEGNRIIDENGSTVNLQGMSFFWSQWKPQYYNADAVKWLKNDWKVSLLRAAMAVEHDGYLTNPEVEKEHVEAVVNAAIAEGLYVIIDWHDHNSDQHIKQASQFFEEMAVKYGHHPNVFFEVFNEPVRQDWSTVIKPYHETIVSVIRKHSNNLIILGTRFWSQEVDVAAADPVAGENLAYTIHFYASSHRQELREKAKRALHMNISLFATEWGTCNATGDGYLDFVESRRWLTFFAENHISHANWAVGDKMEACAALKPGANATGFWTLEGLTESGKFVRSWIRGDGAQGENPPCDGKARPIAVHEG